MSLDVTVAKVKDKAGISGSSYDTKIDNLIDEWLPALEYAIRDSFLADVSNTGLQATLSLGACELVAGEFLAQLAREPGGSETLIFGWMEVRPVVQNLADPYGLKEQGALRLRPFLKLQDSLQGSLGVIVGGDRSGEV